MNPKVDEFILNASRWQPEIKALRAILLDCQLQEELKWRQPCYTFQGVNLAIIASFKSHCALSFLKGTLLQDANQLLVSPGENSQSVRYLSFTNVAEIRELEATLKSYVFEAIEIEKAGIKVVKTKSEHVSYCEELHVKLEEDSTFSQAFEALTPGRKRGYALFFEAAKQAKTRESRIEQYRHRILMGKGINDCVCGLSKRMPNCDGSHKFA